MLATSDVIAFAATTDLARARAFYEAALGLLVEYGREPVRLRVRRARHDAAGHPRGRPGGPPRLHRARLARD